MCNSDQIRTYIAKDCIFFRKTKERYGGLSNMAGGYPLRINGILIQSVEALYQACRFPQKPDIQQKIIEQNSPMTAKMVSRPYRQYTRSDWSQIRVRIMRWCLRVKLVMHWPEFSKLLLSTENKPIVEDSQKDDFWGAKQQKDGTLVGMNVLGRLLMELREELKGPNKDCLQVLDPPPVSNFLLLGKPIERITFRKQDRTQYHDPDYAQKDNSLWLLFKPENFEDGEEDYCENHKQGDVLQVASNFTSNNLKKRDNNH